MKPDITAASEAADAGPSPAGPTSLRRHAGIGIQLRLKPEGPVLGLRDRGPLPAPVLVE